MTINTSDIKLRASERLTDNSDGGGKMTANVIVDALVNNLFPDISYLDRVLGRVSMRKAFLHVDTANLDTLYGSFGIVTDPPDDDKVTITCFTTNSYSDERSQARNRIESYVTKSVESRLYLYGDHFIGQRTISVYCLSDAPDLDVNQVIALSTEKSGFTPNIQYFRVTKTLSRTTQTFYDGGGAFQRDVVLFEVSNPFLFDFFGQEVVRETNVKPPTRIRLTQVADAASYFGCKPVLQAITANSSTVKLSDPYLPLVPSNNAETAVLDQPATLGNITIIPSGNAGAISINLNFAGTTDQQVTRYVGSGIARNSLTLTSGSTTLQDDGAGLLTSGNQPSNGYSGVVDYATGAITLTRTSTFNATWTVTARPGTAFNQQVFTLRTAIKSTNRQLTYVNILRPFPAAGALNVDYLALGKWIRLSDNGTGALVGLTPGQGSGTINYATGSVSVTLGALPDIDSAVIYSWGGSVRTQDRAGDTNILPGRIEHKTANTAIVPSTLQITWYENSVLKTATDDNIGNIKIGTQTVGRVLYSTGELGFRPNQIPDDNTVVTVNYQWRLVYGQIFTLSANGAGNVTFTLPQVPVKPGTLYMRYQTVDTYPYGIGIFRENITVIVTDDGTGNIIGYRRNGADVSPTIGPIGTINYTTGAVQFQAAQTAPGWVPSFSIASGGTCITVSGWSVATLGYEFDAGTPVNVSWTKDTAADTSATEILTLPPIEFDLTPTVTEKVVPGSVRFTFRGNTFVDRFGMLYKNPDQNSNAATEVGTIDYATGFAKLTDYSGTGVNSAVSVKSLLTRFTETGVTALYFRTPGAPIKPGSFVIRANELENSNLLIGSSDINGVITGVGLKGKIDDKSGTVEVEFGEMVAAAAYTTAPWYNAANVVSGQIWRPRVIDPQTATFNTVIFRSIPQNANQIGLDPVRLPQDGRVLGYKQGDVVVVHNTQTVVVASPSANQVVSCGRTNLDDIEVRDVNGKPVESIWYTISKQSGTVTFAPSLSLVGYVLPINVYHKIDEIRQVVDVQITGEIELNAPLQKAYPQIGTYLSSALIFGDLQARVASLYDQDTWTGVWSDLLIGNPVAGANYNSTLYPIQVLNSNTITERWAIIFNSPSTFSVVGEFSGTIGTGTITADVSILNPLTNQPYFVLDKDGWGAGWAAGNVLRFNTIGALAPIWFVRTTLVSNPVLTQDFFKFQIIANAN
jgi:hypothetical protein